MMYIEQILAVTVVRAKVGIRVLESHGLAAGGLDVRESMIRMSHVSTSNAFKTVIKVWTTQTLVSCTVDILCGLFSDVT